MFSSLDKAAKGLPEWKVTEYCNTFPFDGMSRIRFKGTISILYQNTPKAVLKIII